ncbi:MAG: plasmid pRiA4b ORF-3 family protein [Desulfitobacterium hafniense]|nr:plasmid pRiA4b ORF-3 family protein [Desulfitobacterium hafniense]
MQIGCTKKLQDELGLVFQDGAENNDLFCWSAHLITVNRRKTLVIVNDSNRFGFVLHGMKAKDFKNLNEHITQGIRNCLRDEKIKDEIIEQYLQTAGDLVFSKTRGKKCVARLNKACERVEVFNDSLDPGVLFQTIATRHLNTDLIKTDKESGYEYPYELLSKDFEQFAGKQFISCEAVDLMIKLDLGRMTAWRRIITPVDITFKQLHAIIQVAFNWKSSHLYGFNIFDPAGKCVLNVISEFEEVYEPPQDVKILIDSEVKLPEYVHEQYKIDYCYDYGDNWEHEIIIREMINYYEKNYPVCLMGEGNAPPEDVGGISGYEEFLAIISDPKHEDYENTRRWAQGQWYRDFDIDLVNRRLKNILRR